MKGPLVTRRRLLLGGLALGVAGVVTGTGGGPQATVEASTVGKIPNVPRGSVAVERVRSAARGMDVNLVTMAPRGHVATKLPVCLVLHGRGGDARGLVQFGIPQFLTAATLGGVPPFAVVAVDCGKNYLMKHDDDDPMRMLLEELPDWIAERGLTVPMAALGFSMGGANAFSYARRRGDLRAVAMASPGLFTAWSVARTRDAYRDESQWHDYDPLRHPRDLGRTQLGIWCGSEDSFAPATRELIAETRPATSSIGPGGHTAGYWWGVLPDIMRFVGTRLTPAVAH